MYAYFKKLDYFSTECIYAPFAARGLARDFVKDLEVQQDTLLILKVDTCQEFCQRPGRDAAQLVDTQSRFIHA